MTLPRVGDMTRDQKTQEKYKKTLAKIEGCPLCWRLKKGNRLDSCFGYVYIKCDYPYLEYGGRKVSVHGMLISNKCTPNRQTKIRMYEEALLLKPDSIIINQDHHSSIPDHFHIHLIWTSKNTKKKPKSSPTTR